MSDQEPDTQANEGQEHQQENISSTENERENEGQELQQENISSTKNEGENVDGVGLQESTNSGIDTEKEGQELQQENISSTKNEGENVDGVGLQESTNSGIDTEKMLEGLTNAIACENKRHSQKTTTLVTTAFKELARTIQNPDMVTTALKELVITQQNPDDSVKTKMIIKREKTEEVQFRWMLIDGIKAMFSNSTLNEFTGVPKILFIDTCRGQKDNTSVTSKKCRKKSDPMTTDSDCITIFATTPGFTANIPDEGSVGIQGVMEIFEKNWEKDHLEEMLIDARMNVSTWGKDDERQIPEIQTTLLKRLMFEKFVV